MVRILCIGDSHIPNRAKEIPERIYDELDTLTKDRLFDFTLFTGDVIKFPKLLGYLNLKTNKNLYVVMGNMDYHYGNRDAPLHQKLVIPFEDNEKIILGLTHGAQISPRGDHSQLETLAIEKKYNLLVSGHTHKEEIYLTEKGILLINPGSVTGAWSFVASGIPSFIELKINESTKEISIDLIQIDKRSREIITLKSNYFFRDNRVTDSLI
jgi:putative phosphoesterase